MSKVTNIYNLLIVDDDLSLLAYLKEYLSNHNYTVSVAHQGEDIKNLVRDQVFSLVILDVLLPGKDGYFWLQWLKHNYPNTKVLMSSVRGEVDDRILGIESGADEYLAKPVDPRELLARINNMLRPSHKPKEQFYFDDFCFDFNDNTLSKGRQLVKLTTSESSVLACLCSNHSTTLSRDQLAHILYGVEHSPMNRSLDVHIFNLRTKLEEDPSNPKYIQTVWGKGYRFLS